MSSYLRSLGVFLRTHRRVIAIAIPILAGVLYMFLCMVQLRQSIWFDESYSAYLVRFDFGKIWELTSADVHPPLFYFALKTWAHFFGHTDFAMRMLSVVCGAIAILFAYLWLKYKYGVTVAALASLLFAISPVFVRYGQEMRMYTMVAAIVFIGTYVLQLAIDNKRRRWWILYAIIMALGMWTHYFCFFAWIAHLVYLFVIYKKKFFQKRIILTYVLAILLFVPWVPSLIAQTAAVQNGFWIGDVSVNTMANYWTTTFVYNMASDVRNWLVPLMILVTAIFIFLAVRYRAKLKLLLMLAFVPVIGLILLSMPPFEPVFISRYIIYAMVTIPVIAGAGLVLFARGKSSKKLHRRHVAMSVMMVVVLIGTSICGLSSVYAYGNYNFETNIKTSSKELFETVAVLDNGHGGPIISSSEWLYYDLAFYSTTKNPVYFMNETVDYKYGSLYPLRDSALGRIDNLDQFLKNFDYFWYITYYEDGELTSQFPREDWHIAEYSTFKNSDHGESYAIVKMTKE